MEVAVRSCCDCAVIGAGPAGLAAAVYLARFNRKVLVFGCGKSRAEWSPRNRNYPGFPEGVPGVELLQRFKDQAEEFHVPVLIDRVQRLEKGEDGFTVHTAAEAVEARRVILATGVTDHWPEVPEWEKLAGTRIRVCPICDAYEARDRRIGILGCSDKVARETLYLRKFSCEVVLFTHGLHEETPICEELHARLGEEGITVRHEQVERLLPLDDEGVIVCLKGGVEEQIDMLFSALGTTQNSDLATALGAEADEDGYLLTNRSQETNVPGLYAVGDITTAINQITVGVGQAAIAATCVHNSLLDF